MKISPRLQAIIELIPHDCKILADIGTDHGYLSIEAAQQGLCEKAIACDVNKKPLESAEKNIKIFASNLTRPIETRLGNGLEPLESNEADCIVIAGMGGMLITEILSASWEKITNSRLILQPQHDVEELRRFLHANKYNIIEEKIVHEPPRFYVIISAQRDKITPYTDAEYFHGKTPTLPYLNEMHKKITGYINSIKDENAQKLSKKRIKWLRFSIEALENALIKEEITNHDNRTVDN